MDNQTIKKDLSVKKYWPVIWKIYQASYFVLLCSILIICWYEDTTFSRGIVIAQMINEIANILVYLLIPILVGVNIVSILCSLINKVPKTYKWYVQEIVVAVVTTIAFVAPYIIVGYPEPFWIAILIVCSHRIDFKTILKVFIIASSILWVVTVLSSMVGLIEDIIYYRGNGAVRHSFGFSYATVPTTRLFFIIVSWIWLRLEKTSIIEIVVIYLSSVFCLVACNARTAFICLILLATWLLWTKIYKWLFKSDRYTMTKPLQVLCLLSFPLITIGMTILSIFYNPDIAWMSKLNSLLSTRLSLGHEAFSRLNISLLGQYVESSPNGWGIEPTKDYFFIDCTYLNTFFRYGLIAFIVLFFIVMYICVNECNKKNYIRLGLLAIIIAKCAMEYHLIQISFTPLLLYILAYDSDLQTGFDFKVFKFINEKEKERIS